MEVSQDYAARGRSRSRSRSRSASRSRQPVAPYKRRSRLYLGFLSNPNMIYSFKRTVMVPITLNPSLGFYPQGITGGTQPSGRGLGIDFALSRISINGLNGGAGTWNVPSYTEFSQLFDNFRIKKVVMKIVWNQNIASDSAPTLPLPVIQCCADDDDAAPPASSTELLQRPEMKVHAFGSGNDSLIHYITVYPTAKMAGQSATVTQQMGVASKKQWIDMSYPDTEFYGYKLYWDTRLTTNAEIGDLSFYFDIYFDFKGVR